MLEALRHLSSAADSDTSRIALLHNPASKGAERASLLAMALEAALQLPSRRAKLPSFLQATLSNLDLLAASHEANQGEICLSG